MKHRIVTAAQMKEIERAGDAHGLSYLQMMENAGLAALFVIHIIYAIRPTRISEDDCRSQS